MRYGYFTRIEFVDEIPMILEDDDFLPPLKDYFEVIYSITTLDKVVLDTSPYRPHLDQLIDKIKNDDRKCELYILSLYDLGRYTKHIVHFLLNLPKNVDLFIFNDKVNVPATISYICEKYNSIYDLVASDDYIKVI